MANVAYTVQSVLSSPSAMKIDFHLGLINVDAAGLMGIRYLLTKRVVKIFIRRMEDDAEAQYAYPENALMFPRLDYGASPLEKASIVHECIHALHDLYGAGYYHPKGGSRFISRSANEAAAYVAGSLYHLYETGSPLGSGLIFQTAGTIARRIMNQRGAFVSTAESTALRLEIVKFAKSSSDPRHRYEFNDLTIADGV